MSQEAQMASSDLLERLHALADRYREVANRYSYKDVRHLALINVWRDLLTSQMVVRIINELGDVVRRGLMSLEEATQTAEDWEKFQRLGLVTLAQFRLEYMLGTLVRALGLTIKGPPGFHNYARALVDGVGLSPADDKVKLLMLPAYLRNSLHSGGIHTGKDFVDPLGRPRFEMKHGKLLHCVGWLHILDALDSSLSVVEELLSSRRVFENVPDPLPDDGAWMAAGLIPE